MIPFVMIRCPEGESTNSKRNYDILDLTRIHHEYYKLAQKIATDACGK